MTIARARTLLGKYGNNLSDKEVTELLSQMRVLAECVFSVAITRSKSQHLVIATS